MKKKIAKLIKMSLPEYDDSDPMNVKIVKGNPITIKNYLNMLWELHDRRSYNIIHHDHYMNHTKIYKNVFAKSLLEGNLNPLYNKFKKNKINNFMNVLNIINPKVYNKVINIINKECK